MFGLVPHFIGGPGAKNAEETWRLIDPSRRASVTVEDILARKKFHYNRILATLPIAPRDGFIAFFKKIHARGIPMSIGSLTVRDHAEKLLSASGLLELFDRSMIVLAEDVENLKPAPDVFLETARRMNIDPRDQLVFEDSPHGVQAALAAGSRVIGMPVYDRPETIDPLRISGASDVFMHWNHVTITY